MAETDGNPQILFPARFADVELVHAMLMAAIDETQLYGATFKANERRRMNRSFLRTLIDTDPFYVMLVRTEAGENAGLMISGPEFGSLFLYWCYLTPRHRIGTLAMRSMRDFVAHWDHGHFHKVVALVRPGNRSPRLIMKRNGYRELTLLERHLFGEDYILCERPLVKTQPGYDNGLASSFSKRLRLKARSVLG